jgi:hypothetical protein
MDDPLFDQLEAIHAYDTGSTDSGVHDEQLRARLVAELVELNPWENAEARRRLSVWVREAYLSEEAMVKGDTDGSQEWLRELPDAIASCADAGLPVIVDLPPTLSPAHQRLMGTLGVLVRFVQPRTEE